MWALEMSPEVLKFVEVFENEKQQQAIIITLNKFHSDVLLKTDQLEKSLKSYFHHKYIYIYIFKSNILFLGIIHEDLSMNNIIMKDNKILGIIDLGDVLYSFTIFDFAVALCYLILHEFEDNNAKLSDVHIKSFVNSYEKQYRNLNDMELSMIHVIIQKMCSLQYIE